MLNYKMQILCLCLLIYIGIYHSRCRHLQTRKIRLFNHIVAVSIINIIFDIITVYCVNHLERVSAQFNRFSHQVFIGSLNLFIYLISSYIVLNIDNKRKHIRKLKIIQGLPLIGIFLIIAFGPIYYYVGAEGAYSYGPAALTCYASVIIFTCMDIYILIRYWKDIDEIKRRVILPSVIIMLVIALIQGIAPATLLTGMGLVFIVFGLFFSLENPDSFIDKKNTAFTMEGFHLVLKDLWNEDKSFKVLSIYIKNINEIRAEHGISAECILMKEVRKLIYRKYHIDLFMTYDGCVSIIIQKDKESKIENEDIPHYLDQGFHIKDTIVYLNYEIYSIDSRSCKNPEDVLEEIFKKANEIQYVRAYTDIPTGLSNRNAYEKDMNHIYNLRNEYSNIWYVILDLNNLKQVNDQYGHIDGDDLLKESAKILRKVVNQNHRVYRIGGDEFCIIILNESEEQVEALLAELELERQTLNKTRKVPISFALGYSAYHPEADIDLSDAKARADKMMYQIKDIMKRK